MAAWAGLGVNYASTVQLDNDIDYFKSVGLQYVRVFLPAASDTDARDSWRAVAKRFTNEGFYVIWGVTQTPITSANWSTYASNVLAEAALCQAQATCSEFQLGNELEFHNDASITDAQVRVNIRALASQVKSVFTRGPISYS